ncbi:transcription factor [Sorochytrium milnesiophthora]
MRLTAGQCRSLHTLLRNPTHSMQRMVAAERAKNQDQEQAISEQELKRLCGLAGLMPPATPEDTTRLTNDVNSIRRFVTIIQRVDTTGVEPLMSIAHEHGMRLEHDLGAADSSSEQGRDLVSLAKKREGQFFVTNKVKAAPSSRPVRVAELYPNSAEATNVQAYAKLQGFDWTYYIQKVQVSIGRSSENATQDSADLVDVDLGPAKVVSRSHAAIQYNFERAIWECAIFGRNGIKRDNQPFKPDVGTVELTNGNLVEIGGVQFVFLLPMPEDHEQADVDGDSAVAEDDEGVAAGAATGTGLTTRTKSQRKSTGRKRDPAKAPNPSKNKRPTPPPLDALQPAVIPADFMQHRDFDYSDDSAKDVKPPYSYATLIAEAINSAPIKAMSLSEIYQFISTNYAYYRHGTHTWQNSVRHNLSLNRAFQKVARPATVTGKGNLWRIDAAYAHELTDEPKKQRSSSLHHMSSTGSSSSSSSLKRGYAGDQHDSLAGYGLGMGLGMGLDMISGLYDDSNKRRMLSSGYMGLVGKDSNGGAGGNPYLSAAGPGAGGAGGYSIGNYRSPYRPPFYSLYSNIPDLTELPLAHNVMRSLPSHVYKRFRLIDEDPPLGFPGGEKDALAKSGFLDRSKFVRIGEHINKPKWQSPSSSSVPSLPPASTSSALAAAMSALGRPISTPMRPPPLPGATADSSQATSQASSAVPSPYRVGPGYAPTGIAYPMSGLSLGLSMPAINPYSWYTPMVSPPGDDAKQPAAAPDTATATTTTAKPAAPATAEKAP